MRIERPRSAARKKIVPARQVGGYGRAMPSACLAAVHSCLPRVFARCRARSVLSPPPLPPPVGRGCAPPPLMNPTRPPLWARAPLNRQAGTPLPACLNRSARPHRSAQNKALAQLAPYFCSPAPQRTVAAARAALRSHPLLGCSLWAVLAAAIALRRVRAFLLA